MSQNQPSGTSYETPVINKVKSEAITPTKSPYIKSLPPLSNGSLKLPKKRILDSQNDLDATPSNKLIPVKPSFSTPMLKKRIVSLQDSSIPDLSPATDTSVLSSSQKTTIFSPSKRIEFSSPASIRSFSSPVRFSSKFSTSKSSSSLHNVLKIEEATKEPLKEGVADAKRDDRLLNLELKQAEKELDLVKKAYKYTIDKEDEKLVQLIDKWQDVAQRASNYLLNSASTKISKMGGMSEFRRREREKKKNQLEYNFDNSLADRYEEIMQSDEFKELSTFEKNDIKKRYEEAQEEAKKLLEKQMELEKNAELDESDDNMTMKELYKQLNLDYNLVYDKD